MLNDAQRDRYSRQVLFAPIGEQGQTALTEATVLVVGCGALGTVMVEALARAGVGTLRIADRDIVERSNLARQILFTEAHADAVMPKALAAAEAVATINSTVRIEPHVVDVTPDTILGLAEGCALLLDGTDNLETRFLINDAAVKLGIPWIYTGAVGSSACSMPIVPGETACLHCILDGPPEPGAAPVESCDTVGVIAPTVMIASSLSLAEALKLLVGDRDNLRRSLVYLDCWQNTRHEVSTKRPRRDCPVCGERTFRYLDTPRATQQTAVLCGRNAVQITPAASSGSRKLDFAALEGALPANVRATIARTSFTLRFTVDGHDVTVFADGRTLVHGTDDPARARAVVARYIGA